MYEGGYSAMTTGWVETAQGWEYYDNSGKRVMEGWAAGERILVIHEERLTRCSNKWCPTDRRVGASLGADGKMVTGKVCYRRC